MEKIFISFYVGTYIKSTLALTVARWLVPIIIIILLLFAVEGGGNIPSSSKGKNTRGQNSRDHSFDESNDECAKDDSNQNQLDCEAEEFNAADATRRSSPC